MYRSTLIAIIFLFATNWLYGQCTFIIEELPSYTPDTAKIYMATSFNNWDPSDSSLQLSKFPDGTYRIQIPKKYSMFKFKFTRGSWESVEGNSMGDYMYDREYIATGPIQERRFKVFSWQDLEAIYSPPIKIILDKIPLNTPNESRIYLAGSINEWAPNDPNYEFLPNEFGLYELVVPSGIEHFEYKITRGSWISVEVSPGGKSMRNRVFDRSNLQSKNEEVHIQVDAWEDLARIALSPTNIMQLIFSFQAFFILVYILIIQKRPQREHLFLYLFLIVLFLSNTFRIVESIPRIFNAYPKLVLITSALYDSLGIWAFLSIKKYFIHNITRKSVWYIVFLFSIVPGTHLLFLFMPNEMIVNKTIQGYYAGFYIPNAISLALNLSLCLYSYHLYKKSPDLFDHNKHVFNYISGILYSSFVLMSIWLATFAIGCLDIISSKDYFVLKENFTDIGWIATSIFASVVAFLFTKYPTLFSKNGISLTNLEENKLADQIEKLKHILQDEKVYLNPNLTLSQLAKLMNTNTHTLSKIINDGCKQNFNDFVNSYRVNAFIEEVNKDKNRKQTFLNLAMSVGFNSKTAFNRAFKKMTGTTPSKYFSEQ